MPPKTISSKSIPPKSIPPISRPQNQAWKKLITTYLITLNSSLFLLLILGPIGADRALALPNPCEATPPKTAIDPLEAPVAAPVEAPVEAPVIQLERQEFSTTAKMSPTAIFVYIPETIAQTGLQYQQLCSIARRYNCYLAPFPQQPATLTRLQFAIELNGCLNHLGLNHLGLNPAHDRTSRNPAPALQPQDQLMIKNLIYAFSTELQRLR